LITRIPSSLTTEIQRTAKSIARVVHIDKLKEFLGTPPKSWLAKPQTKSQLRDGSEEPPDEVSASGGRTEDELLPSSVVRTEDVRKKAPRNGSAESYDETSVSSEMDYEPCKGPELDQSLVTGENVRAELPRNSSEVEAIRAKTAKRKLVSSEATAATTLADSSQYEYDEPPRKYARRTLIRPSRYKNFITPWPKQIRCIFRLIRKRRNERIDGERLQPTARASAAGESPPSSVRLALAEHSAPLTGWQVAGRPPAYIRSHRMTKTSLVSQQPSSSDRSELRFAMTRAKHTEPKSGSQSLTKVTKPFLSLP